ncbi:MAG: tRNA pseudouridine(38-40) synthase TruA [Promethearchaeota archaeon]|nr:MAG: tRNA pseudouridine(38-40) synthase TruA [Candidatus Lokiarchaeota archaeon]
MRFALKIFYLGKYAGFQRQPDRETVEGYLLQAFEKGGLISDWDSASYVAAGRTDKAVHALGQVVAISSPKIPIIRQLNSLLPKDIVIWGSQMVKDDFNPRFEALSRNYRYYTRNTGMNVDLMEEGAKLLEGVHDFNLFSKYQPGKNTIRDIHQIRIEQTDEFLIFDILADSFLWQMVRRIVDALLKIGREQWVLRDIQDLLSLSPKANIYTEPQPVEGEGLLILWNIEYPFQFELDKKGVTNVKRLIQDLLVRFSLKAKLAIDLDSFFNQL